MCDHLIEYLILAFFAGFALAITIGFWNGRKYADVYIRRTNKAIKK